MIAEMCMSSSYLSISPLPLSLVETRILLTPKFQEGKARVTTLLLKQAPPLLGGERYNGNMIWFCLT